MLKLSVVIGILLAATTTNGSSYGGGGGGGGFPPQQPQYPPPQQQQQQQQQQQDSYGNQQQGRAQQQSPPYPQQYGMQPPLPPPQGQYSSSGPPQGYGVGAITPYGRGPPPSQGQEQVGGMFAKFKSSLVAASQVFTGGSDLQGTGQQQQGYQGIQGPNQGGQRRIPQGPGPGPGPGQYSPQGPGPGPSSMGPGPGQNSFGPRPPPPQQQQQQQMGPPGYYPPRPAQYQEEQEGGGGLLGKLKGLFNSDDQQQQQQQQQRGPPGPRPFAPPLPGMYQHTQGPPRGPPPQSPPLPPPQYQYNQPPPPPPPQYGAPIPPPQYPNPFPPSERDVDVGYPQPPSYPYDEPQIVDAPNLVPPPPPGVPPQHQQQQQQQHGSYSDNMYPQTGYQDSSHMMQQHQEEPRQAAHLSIPAEPSVMIEGDCIVLVLKPQEFFRKKLAFTAGGAGSMQVFSDFEHVLTHTRVAGARTVGSGELLECAQNVLSQNAITQLRAVAADFALVEEGDMDDAHFEEFTARCQSIVAREGGLHIANVAPATRDLSPRLGLRDGWKEALTALASAGVPTFVFSSGHGDVISQAFLQGGLGADSGSRNPSPGGQILPQNLRIISNFFRTAPDGSVRAFSQPVVHERNKNATTASRHMGMPVPDRPNALVFGSHEDDLLMTEGSTGLREQITVGFLELSDDLPQRLPSFLNSFDAVVIGESSFAYGKSLIEELLQIAPAPRGPKGKPSLLERLNMGGLSPEMF